MHRPGRIALILTSLLLGGAASLQQDDKILERGEKLLEEAKAAYEEARVKSSVAAFVDAGFKLEEARIKFIVFQEIGTPEKQKIATDRMRAVNQLGKLIHDGKVAIAGTPAEPGLPARPADQPASPAKEDVAKADPEPAKPAPDVSKRAAIPDAARQKEAEKQIRDLFKEQYGKKSPSERQALAKALLDQAAKTSDDPPALWVLCREAQDICIQIGDVRGAIRAVDAVARQFDVDDLTLKQSALTAVGKLIKTPAEAGDLAAALLDLVDLLIGADQYESADKMTAMALLAARKSNDAALVARATTRSKVVAEAKSRFLGMKSMLQTLAKSPDDPGANSEMGQFLCFVKGSWDLGLRFLSKGSDAALKSLAERELAVPEKGAEQVAVADGWWELADKEKSPLGKGQMQAHARQIYETALPSVTGILRAKVEKRVEQFDAVTTGLVNLLRLIDPKVDAVLGPWQLEDGILTCPNLAFARLLIPYLPPEEYDLTVVLKRRAGGDGIIVGMAAAGTQFEAVIDSYVGPGGVTYLENLDGGGSLEKNPNVFHGHVIPEGGSGTILCSVRKKGVSITVNGRKLVSWEGDYKRLSPNPMWGVPDKRCLFIGGYTSSLEISKLTLLPVTGQGKKLR